jgi:hypothetical protein
MSQMVRTYAGFSADERQRIAATSASVLGAL